MNIVYKSHEVATADIDTPAVTLQSVSMSYDGKRLALSDVNLAIAKGSFVSIVGPSGCGKSTILRLVSGMMAPTRGRVLVDGVEVNGPPASTGFMFQRDALLPWQTVAGNIGFGFECRGVARAEATEHTEELINLLGLSGFGDAYPSALSGGMRQRAALGRLLAYNPDIYLMDEPFGALDAQTKLQMGQELAKLWSQRQRTVLFVTHDVEEAIGLSDRILVVTGRPGTIKADYRVPFPRPRNVRGIRRDQGFHELVDQIWSDLASEVVG